MATVLVAGATGMTGRRLVEQLLDNNHDVRVIVRSPEKVSPGVLGNPNLMVKEAAILDLAEHEIAELVKSCDAVVSCLGHVINFNGLFGEPRKLCTDATRRLCNAIERNEAPVHCRFILMSSVGVNNPALDEKRAWHERYLLFLLRHCLPPHRDNETAAEYLHRDVVPNNKYIEWCSVRPDSLINAEVSPYEIMASPNTGILAGRPATRANVAHFMVTLIENDKVWNTWKFRMPVIMDAGNTG